MTNLKIGVLGSAFDPPTLGHLDILQQVAPFFSTVLLVPSASHAFAKKMQDFNHRVEMLNCLLSCLSANDCSFEISTLEQALLEKEPARPVYTFDLLEALEIHYGQGVSLSFIRGPDNARPEVWGRFYKADEIIKRWSVFTAKERLQVRSSKVRQVIAANKLSQEKEVNLEQWVPEGVAAYINHYGLYSKELI